MSSAVARVFNGCRALLGPAKSSATAATKTKPTTSKKPRAKSPPKSKPPGSSRPLGILKVGPVSPALAHFLGASESSRTDAVRKIWSHIKTHSLQNPQNKREIICDAKLKAIFDGKDTVGFLEIAKLLSPHFVKTA
ncbi:upstream activation factor subunit UAF30-like [Mangifera indica]|uniref:upstream activation factor subunit UAF30-like n=1 Tax=Mangifera indica TaxID=29780 RepID=UPI001CFB8FD8|nr:upstream activation factor subunit UAF30-like [Mangifera indica]XP_044499670.1 upstream activation factor subunit UAF30-like [Mangifera indica]